MRAPAGVVLLGLALSAAADGQNARLHVWRVAGNVYLLDRISCAR